MRIALDAMGGDFAPEQTVKGAYEFLQETAREDVSVLLAGPENILKEEISKYDFDPSRYDLIPTSQIVAMDEKPARVVKTKPDSSLVRAVQSVKDGQADGIISAGNTGAMVAASLFLIQRITGVRRPALCPFIPTAHGGFVLCDAGANVDVRARDLVQFALMARAYIIHLFDHLKPRVGLLNIGAEAGKGNDMTNRAYGHLAEHVTNFIGNVEARDLFAGVVDVVVCDGFVGNILVKFGEGVIQHLAEWAKSKLKRHPVSLLSLPLMKPALKDLYHELDHEEYGGWPLLGLNGVSIVCHGSSSSKAIKNALKTATRCVTGNLIADIEENISAHLDIFEEKNAIPSTS